jgi:hypothetical protein
MCALRTFFVLLQTVKEYEKGWLPDRPIQCVPLFPDFSTND